jgi:hypothetical protein
MPTNLILGRSGGISGDFPLFFEEARQNRHVALLCHCKYYRMVTRRIRDFRVNPALCSKSLRILLHVIELPA